MNREEVRDEILNINNPNILCELPTSFGKTKVALDIMKKRCTKDSSILIVIPRKVLIDNWKDEFKKWDMMEYLPNTEFVTYVSFPKKAGEYDLVIFDEAHHLSERCRDAVYDYSIKNSILLSATVGRDLRYEFQILFPGLHVYKVSTKEAIKEAVLPDPKVYLIPDRKSVV